MSGARGIGTGRENAARTKLEALGWTVLAVRAKTASGELDIIALDGEIVVFAEVRYRTRASIPESITPQKARRLWAAAEEWLYKHTEHLARQARFDLVGWEDTEWVHIRGFLDGS